MLPSGDVRLAIACASRSVGESVITLYEPWTSERTGPPCGPPRDSISKALDVSVQAQVLDIIDELVRRTGMGLIFISHDLNLVSSYCDRILVMRGGEVVEECAAGQLGNATHPYTRGLLAAIPRIDETRDELPVLDRSGWAA